MRRLPPTMTEEEFMEAINPVPEYDYFTFCPADNSLGLNAFTRAYINFKNSSEIFNFRDKFDGYVFVDQKGKLLFTDAFRLGILSFVPFFSSHLDMLTAP